MEAMPFDAPITTGVIVEMVSSIRHPLGGLDTTTETLEQAAPRSPGPPMALLHDGRRWYGDSDDIACQTQQTKAEFNTLIVLTIVLFGEHESWIVEFRYNRIT